MKTFKKNVVQAGQKYDVDIETIAKPKAEYMTNEYFELDLPVAPAVMVDEEIVVVGTDVPEKELERVINRQLGLPAPKSEKKGALGSILKK
jgi:hypothetical protein